MGPSAAAGRERLLAGPMRTSARTQSCRVRPRRPDEARDLFARRFTASDGAHSMAHGGADRFLRPGGE
eukprot:195118-Chlamydomonas_euryale.AAC.4